MWLEVADLLDAAVVRGAGGVVAQHAAPVVGPGLPALAPGHQHRRRHLQHHRTPYTATDNYMYYMQPVDSGYKNTPVGPILGFLITKDS